MRKKRTLHDHKRNKTRSKKGGFLLRWLRKKISRNRDNESGRKHRSMKNESEKWYHRYNPLKLFTRRQKDYRHLFEKKKHPNSHKHQQHYYQQDDFDDTAQLKTGLRIDGPEQESKPVRPQSRPQDDPSDLFSGPQHPFEQPNYQDEAKPGLTQLPNPPVTEQIKEESKPPTSVADRPSRSKERERRTDVLLETPRRGRDPTPKQPQVPFVEVENPSLWKAHKGGKWVDVTRDELRSIEEYRKPETIEVGHGRSGAFIVTFSHGPLSSNTEYVSQSNDDGEQIHFKYDPTDDQRPSSNKEREWMVLIDRVSHEARDHQIEAVMKYRNKIISFVNPEGRMITNKFSTVDTPGDDTIYAYVTEHNNVVIMIYAEKKETEPTTNRFISEDAPAVSLLDPGVDTGPVQLSQGFANRLGDHSGFGPPKGFVSGTSRFISDYAPAVTTFGPTAKPKQKENSQGLASRLSDFSGFIPAPVSVEMKVPPYTNAIELYDLYNPKYGPPRWALEPKYSDPSSPLMKNVQIYSTSKWGDALQQCITMREPANVTMSKKYRNPFDSGYTAWYKKNGRLAPNLAVYADCFMSMDGRNLEESKEERQLIGPKLVHVFNSVGFAFDHRSQPDYQYYLPSVVTKEKREELVDDFTNVLLLFLRCAEMKGFRNLCFCYLGGSAFKKQYEKRGFVYIDLFVLALEKALWKLANNLMDFDNVYFMGNTSINPQEKDKILSKLKPYYDEGFITGEIGFVGYIPTILSELNTETTLFMNAWDPHSVVGNGNESDRSLDGWFGRLSNLALLCTPATNPNMLRPEAFVYVQA